MSSSVQSAPLDALPRPMENTLQSASKSAGVPRPPPPPPVCRPNCPRAILHIPKAAIVQSVENSPENSDTVPLTIGFDARGPHVCVALGEYKTTAPFSQASLQKDIYHSGQRYWRKWEQQESQLKDAEDARKPNKNVAWIVGGAVVLLLVIFGVCAWAVLSSKSGAHTLPPSTETVSPAVHQQPAHPPQPPQTLQSRTAQIDLSRLRNVLHA